MRRKQQQTTITTTGLSTGLSAAKHHQQQQQQQQRDNKRFLWHDGTANNMLTRRSDTRARTARWCPCSWSAARGRRAPPRACCTATAGSTSRSTRLSRRRGCSSSSTSAPGSALPISGIYICPGLLVGPHVHLLSFRSWALESRRIELSFFLTFIPGQNGRDFS